MPDRDPEWQTLVFDRSAATQDGLGYRRYLIVFWIGRVDHRQLDPPGIFGIIFRVTVGEAHVALNREQIREQSAREHDDEPGVGEMNAELPPRPFKPAGVRRDEIDEQNRADQMAPGENRNLESVSFRRPPDEHALEIALL